jgi:hypothetical protein
MAMVRKEAINHFAGKEQKKKDRALSTKANAEPIAIVTFFF